MGDGGAGARLPMISGSRTKNDRPVVGLDIEAGSIAADRGAARTARARGPDGDRPARTRASCSEGEVGRPRRALRRAQGPVRRHKLAQDRSGSGSPTSGSSSARCELPLIEDRRRARGGDPLPGPGARSRCRSTRRSSTTRSSRSATARMATGDGRPRRRRAPRHGRRRCSRRCAAPACSRSGSTSPAFGMIRALGIAPAPMAAEVGRRRRRPTHPLLPPRRRHQPRRRPRQRVPLHPRQPVRHRGDRRSARQPRGARPRRGARVADRRRPRGGRSSCSTRRRAGRRRPRGPRGGRHQARRRAAHLARLLRRPGGRHAGRPRRALRPRQRDPRAARADPGRASSLGVSVELPAALSHLDAGGRRAPDRLLRTGARGVAMRPVNLIPPEERRGDRAAMRTGVVLLRADRRPRASPCSAVVALALTGKQISDRKTEVAAAAGAGAAGRAKAQSLQSFTDFRAVQESALRHRHQPRAEPLRLAAGPQRARAGDPVQRLARPSSPGRSDPTRRRSTDGARHPDPGRRSPGPRSRSWAARPARTPSPASSRISRRSTASPASASESSERPDEPSGADDRGAGRPATRVRQRPRECRTRDFITQFKIVVAFDAVPTPATATATPSVPSDVADHAASQLASQPASTLRDGWLR